MPSLTADKSGKTYWRSLDELADTPEFRQWVATEFPSQAEKLLSSSRRGFLKIMAASFALAGLGAATGCRRWPDQKIAPYARRPEDRMPGVAEQYATAFEIAGIARPVLATAMDGRPIKIEGNDQHPASRGAADVFTQASVLELYDPQRNPAVAVPADQDDHHAADQHDWDAFQQFAAEHFAAYKTTGGAGLAVLAEAGRSPSVAAMKAGFDAQFPNADWVEYESISADNEFAGTELFFGRPLNAQLHLDKAKFIVSFDADLIGSHVDALRHARDFMVGRNSVDDDDPTMSRLYVAESSFTLTGAAADHRQPVPASDMHALAHLLWSRLSGNTPKISSDQADALVPPAAAEQLVKELSTHHGQSLIVAGANQSAQVHALCLAINQLLGNIGKTLTFTAAEERPSHADAIAQLTKQLNDNEVSTLVILGGNPVYDAPADLDFPAALAKAQTRIHLSHFHNETSDACDWWLHRAHYLESWADGRDTRGVVTITQPLIQPLYNGRSVIELLALITGDEITAGDAIVRHTLARLDETAWRTAVHAGFVADSADPTVAVGNRGYSPTDPPQPAAATELNFRTDLGVYDGRFANNGWLQELPDPITKITWDNVAIVSQRQADLLGVKNGDLIKITVGKQSIDIPAWIMHGQPDLSITVQLGYGRTHAGHVGNDVGVNVNTLRATGNMWVVPDIQAEATGDDYQLASTEHHHAVETDMLQEMLDTRVDKLVREADSLEKFKQHGESTFHEHHAVDVKLQQFDSPVSYDGHKWGMAIDLNKCIGCNACVVACQAENNIPIVGKSQVAIGREMHWIRIDRYFKDNSHRKDGNSKATDPQMAYQPVTCHHCENAPCEQVCPVAATTHDSEGLNAMVYNRCIGTRYCSNNCPYKVRRFNYFDFHARDPRNDGNTAPFIDFPDQQQLKQVDEMHRNVYNPEVTVRMRGVMEKCTFCTQRITAARITARNEFVAGDRETDRVEDGQIVSACQQTCPTQAIVFGDLNDPNSRISKLQPSTHENTHGHARAYTMLDELNVRPRLNYLGRVRNPGGKPAGAAPHNADGSTETH